MRCAGRVALITGAAGGIGSAVALALAREGADVVLADCRPCTAVAAAVRPLGRRVRECVVDVTSREEVVAMVAGTVEAFGRIDVLVNVAGVASFGPAMSLAEAEWDRVIDINLKGTFLCCQAAMPHMRAQGHGRIVNMGSILGKNGGNPRPWIDPGEQDKASNVAYGVSKAGVHAMTVWLAKELAGHGVTVNAVAPGPVASAMTTSFPAALKALIPVGRMGETTDVAEAVAFLASDAASFITGEILDVNGGMWGD